MAAVAVATVATAVAGGMVATNHNLVNMHVGCVANLGTILEHVQWQHAGVSSSSKSSSGKSSNGSSSSKPVQRVNGSNEMHRNGSVAIAGNPATMSEHAHQRQGKSSSSSSSSSSKPVQHVNGSSSSRGILAVANVKHGNVAIAGNPDTTFGRVHRRKGKRWIWQRHCH